MTATPPGRRTDSAREPGFALFIVLWFLVLLAAVGTYVLASARTEAALARNGIAAAHAEALADAGVAEAIFNESQSDAAKRWALNGTPYAVTLPAGSLALRMADENEKINPSRASANLLAALWVTLGAQPPTAMQVASAIVDWTRPQPKGASPPTDPYRDAGLGYQSPHRPLESIEELRLVIGVTPAMYDAARPYLTMYGDRDAPDPRGAAPVVAQALAAAAMIGATNASNAAPAAASVNAAPATTMGAPASGNAPPNTANVGDSGTPSSPPANAAATATASAVITVDATAASRDGGVFVRHAVVKIDNAEAKGYRVLAWERGAVGP